MQQVKTINVATSIVKTFWFCSKGCHNYRNPHSDTGLNDNMDFFLNRSLVYYIF